MKWLIAYLVLVFIFLAFNHGAHMDDSSAKDKCDTPTEGSKP